MKTRTQLQAEFDAILDNVKALIASGQFAVARQAITKAAQINREISGKPYYR